MNTPQFQLQPYHGRTTRFACPSCKKQGQFARYMDVETGELLPDFVGRCNRETSCGYHLSPRQYFEQNNGPEIKSHFRSGSKNYTYKEKTFTKPSDEIKFDNPPTGTIAKAITEPQQAASYIDYSIFKKSLTNVKALENNCFIKFLLSLYGYDITNDLINRFLIGCSKKWEGATVFWQMDTKCKIRTGRIMLYNPITGKRVKEPFNHVNWVHSQLQKSKVIGEFNLNQCFFGEHQLLFDTSPKPVAIVESEKTAIIASVYLPDYIWLAAGGINGLGVEKCGVLFGKKVLLVPDLKAYHTWREQADKIKAQVSCQVIVSDLLEKNASAADREKGLDLADYLLKRDEAYGWALSANDYPLLWDN